MTEPHGLVENVISIEGKCEMIYSCHHEAIEYSIQIRARGASGLFGDWSDKKIIELGKCLTLTMHVT